MIREMKKLFLIRHAKSNWNDHTLSDIERPLNHRGERNAPTMAQRAACKWSKPDLILCSPALRARQTAEKFSEYWWNDTETKICNELYEGSASVILDLFSGSSDKIKSLVAVFHNPVITNLTNLLASTNLSNIPTCGITYLQLNKPNWGNLEVGSCSLEEFDFPKKDSN